MPRGKRFAQNTAQLDFAASLFADTAEPTGVVRETAADTPTASLVTLTPVYAVKLVRTGPLVVHQRPIISTPLTLANLLAKHLHGADREHFVVVLLDTRGRLIGVNTVSIGALSSAVVHPREVFKPAILANAANIVLAHNHPSGDPKPSPEDVAVTRRLAEAGQLLGIGVLDHVVLGEAGRWVSLQEQGLYTPPPSQDNDTQEGTSPGQNWQP